ncbi:MAG: hypothetical protein J6L77_05335 [Coprococcus sp.]|nr:hypothetical protein [Coprococcus sp.]
MARRSKGKIKGRLGSEARDRAGGEVGMAEYYRVMIMGADDTWNNI